MSANKSIIKMEEEKSKTGNVASIKRRQILSNIFFHSTQAFFQKVTIQKGMYGLDLCCGTGGNTLLLKTLVGSEGKMTGIDSNLALVKIAEEKVLQNNLDQIDFRYQNILEWKEKQTYDFVYRGLLFPQLANPSTIFQQVHRSLKPGGFAMAEGLGLSQFRCFPGCYAFDRFIELSTMVEEQNVVDVNIGSQLLSVFQNARFENIQVQQVSPSFSTGKNKQIASLTLEYMAPILIDKKLSTAAELQVLIFELKNFEKQKNSLITLPGIYQVVGYRQH